MIYVFSKFRMEVLHLAVQVHFAGHQATKGCSRCKKVFSGAVRCKDYSSFDGSQWEPRNTEEHREEMLKINSYPTKGEKEQMETLYGTRFTPLVKLPYYDSIRMTIVDPMHNLFSGIYEPYSFP